MAETITANEAAKQLGITLRTLWRWRDAGRISEAGRCGKTVLFLAEDVAAMQGVERPREVRIEEVYMRLAEAQTWEDVAALRRDLAASLCARAEDKGPVEAAWRAATSMAATTTDAEARDRWGERARELGTWLGTPEADTDHAIRYKGRKGSYVTRESAKAELEAAPHDPAYEVARAMSVNRR